MRHAGDKEWSRFYRLGKRFPVDALHARFVRHRYPRHVHDYFVIGLVASGVQSFSCRGARHFTPPGHVFFVNPDEPHTGEPAIPQGYIYRTVYPRADHLIRVAERAGAGCTFFLKDAVVCDRVLATLLLRLHDSLAEDAPAAECEWHLLQALACVLARHTVPRIRSEPLGRERPAARLAVEYMQSHFAEDVSLSRLAAVVGLSPWYFARSFEKALGLPPHAYLESVRVSRARQFLDQGQTPTAAALAAGYADQSHLTHRFRQLLGMTPGQYVRQSNRETR